METGDPYWKLRPPQPDTESDLCACEPLAGVMLRYCLTENPLNCLECNGEVAPERIGFEGELADAIASWREGYGSLYRLWLDSGEYEDWAAARLQDARGQVNVDGLQVVQRLNMWIPAYYGWFEDPTAEGFAPVEQCPVCAGPLESCGVRGDRECGACRIRI